MPCAYNSFIPFRVCFPNSHELIIKEVIKNTAMKNKISMFVGKVLEGKLTRTQYVLQSTASYIMSFTLIPMPTGIDQRRERIWEILSTVKYFTTAVYLSSIGHLLSATHVIWTIPVCRVLSLSLLPSWPTLGELIVLPLETMASGSSHCILPQTEHVSGQGGESEAAQRCQKM